MSLQVTAGSRSSATYFANAEPRSDAGIPASPAGRTFAMLRPGGSVNAFRSSFSRRPRTGVSTVRQIAPYPAFTARFTSCAVTSRSFQT